MVTDILQKARWQQSACFFITTLIGLFIGGQASAQTYDEDLASYKEWVKTLASDEFGGRKPLTEYETKTINYIADEFKKLGLEPANNGSYFQPVQEIAALGKLAKNKISVKCSKGTVDLNFGDDVVVWTDRGTDKIVIPNTDVVFCGFGISAPEYDWDDFGDIDVAGKIVIAMVNDPGFYDQSLFRGRNMTYYGRWTYKFEEATRRGAAAVLVLHNTAAASYDWSVCQNGHTQASISLCTESMNSETIGVKGWLHEDACRRLFEKCGIDFDETIAAAKKPGFKSIVLPAKSKITMNVEYEIGESHNVAAILPGTDLKDEYVVFTAHWDHFGIGKPVDGDSIYNGASDNASGVAAILLMAKKFQQSPIRPRRSIVFVSVTSEESGLLGSEYYCEHPLFPLSKTNANINIDGAAPKARAYDIIIAAAGKTDTDALVAGLAAAQGRVVKFRTEDPGGGYFRSDHFNFVKKGVPSILVGGGRDYVDKAAQEAKPKVRRYHQPNDEYDESWWEFDGAMEDMNLLYGIALILSTNDEMVKWTDKADFQRQ